MRMVRKKEKGKRKKGRIGVTPPVLSPWSAKRSTQLQGSLGSVMVVALALLLVPLAVHANERLESPNYILDPNVANSFGGLSESGNYSLIDSGGEAAIGLGSSDSYKLSSGYIAQLQQSIELNVLPSGLAAYYPFNTGTGIQAYDVTSNSNQGVLTNSPAWVDGKVGDGALDFDGSTQLVNSGDTLDQTNGSFSLSVWFYADDVSSGGKRLIIKDAGSGAGWGLSLGDAGNGRLRFFTRELSVVSTDTLDVISANNWHHAVAIWDTNNNVKRIYVNGDLKAETTGVTGDIVDNSASFGIGATPGGTHYFNGTIDEVKVYDKALSEDEVVDEYNASNSGIASALTLPKITAGASQVVAADAVVITDAGGYDLSIEQTHDLTRVGGSETIPAILSSISNPGLWNEGATEGLGFTVTSGTQVDPKWGTDPDYEYAAIPGSATTFHSRVGLTGGAKEVTELQFRLGVSGAQASGMYKNRVGFTATLKP